MMFSDYTVKKIKKSELHVQPTEHKPRIEVLSKNLISPHIMGTVAPK